MFEQERAEEADVASLLGKMPTTSVRNLSPLRRSIGLVEHRLGPMLRRERHVSEHVGLGLGGAIIHAKNLAPAVSVDVDRDDHRDRDDAAILRRTLRAVGGIDPQIWPVALDWTGEQCLHLVIDPPHGQLPWLLEMSVMPSATTRSFTERVETR